MLTHKVTTNEINSANGLYQRKLMIRLILPEIQLNSYLTEI